MFRWILACAAIVLMSPLAVRAQVSGTIDGPPPAIPNAAETPPTPFTGPATNTRPRLRPSYVRPYQPPFSSYSPNYTWANRPADLVKPVAGFNSPTGTRLFNGYPPSYYAGFVTTGLPTYLTSINYPTVYGAYQYNGVMWAGPGGTTEGASIAVRPWSTYPNTTYNPVAP